MLSFFFPHHIWITYAMRQAARLDVNSGMRTFNVPKQYGYGYHLFEGSLEVKLPTIWTDEKQSRAEAERRGRLEERRSEEKE